MRKMVIVAGESLSLTLSFSHPRLSSSPFPLFLLLRLLLKQSRVTVAAILLAAASADVEELHRYMSQANNDRGKKKYHDPRATSLLSLSFSLSRSFSCVCLENGTSKSPPKKRLW